MTGMSLKGSKTSKAVIVALVLVIALGVSVALCTRNGVRASYPVSVLVDAPKNAYSMSFNRMWGVIAGKAGVEPDGAILQQFRLLYRPSGQIVSFQAQVLTVDHYLLELNCFSEPSVMNVYGSRWEDGPLPQSSWATSLDQTFGVLDRLGVRAFEQPLAPQINAAKDLAAFDVFIDTREYQGGGAVLWMERAFFMDNGSFVRLDPDDPRREFGSTDVALGFALAHNRSNGTASSAADGDYTYFIIPAQ
jgi:hypothetical protein